MPWLAAAAIAAPVIGGLIGQQASKGAADQSAKSSQAALDALRQVKTPDIDQMKLALEQYLRTGEYNPEMEQLVQLAPTALEDIQVDPRLRQQEMSALQTITEKGQNGLTQADLAAFELSRRQAGSEAQARDQQILQNMAQRGQGGSGAEIAMRAIAGQEQANRQSMADLDMASKKEQAKLAALQMAFQGSGELRAQDYGQALDLARANDVHAQYVAQNAQNLGQRNITSRNLAQQQNLAEQQRIADANVNLRNQQQQFNKGLLQQQFSNEMQKATGVASQQNNMANVYANQAAGTQGMYSGIGNAVGAGVSAYGNQQSNEKIAAMKYGSKV